jgi:hypothetical protein
MAYTTLEAVNAVLRRIGKHVVPSLDTDGGSLASYAERELDDASKAVQMEGWSWNTRENIEKTADGAGEYVTTTFEPDNATIYRAFTPDEHDPNVAIEGTKLVNVTENTTTFSETSLKLTYVYEKPMAEIPDAFAQWIIATAALKLSRQFYSDQLLEQLIAAEILDARRRAIRDEIQVSEVNVLETDRLRQLRGRPRMRNRSIYG